MSSRLFIALCILLGTLVLGWFVRRNLPLRAGPQETLAPTIQKQPVNFTNRTFDPANPPSDMPPLTPGENAECDSEFLSNANVAGQTREIDATHAAVIITHVTVTLQLNITIWTPADVSQHVLEHEEGHRQISENYYQTADKTAAEIAGRYMGKQVDVVGTELNAESNKLLQQMASEITDEYNKELNPESAQLLYDNITDHSRNEVDSKDAVAHALKNVSVESNLPVSTGVPDSR